MNARFYAPGAARFLSADTLVPDPANPQSFNRFSYSRNNPINRVDPTGHLDCEFDDYCPPPASPSPLLGKKTLGELEGGKYDLTNWLAEEMASNATGSDMLEIQELRAGNIFQQVAGLWPFFELNTNNGRWDFKEQTKVLLGSEMVVLCGTQEYWNEHPEDWAGVELGYLLYDAFGVDMTPLQLQVGLDMYWDQLQRPDPRLLQPADGIFPPETPYSLGTFDYE